MKSLMVIGLLALSTGVVAGERDYYLDVNLASKHFCESSCPTVNNERNFGLGLTVDFKNNIELKVGGYKNSYSLDSGYVLVNYYREWKRDHWTLRAGAAMGLVYGYKGTEGELRGVSFANHEIQPGILPNVTIGYKHAQAMIGCVGNVVTLQGQWRFN